MNNALRRFLLNNSWRLCWKIVSWLASAFIWIVLLVSGLWAFGALWFDFPLASLTSVAASGFAVGFALVLAFIRPWWRAKLGLALTIAIVVGWWFTQQACQYRDWKPEVLLTPYATIEGEVVTMHNVRNFDYRSEEDFTPRYEVRHLDLRNLRGLDIFITYWGSPYMAHPILSFDFGPDGRVCFSIETRPVRGQAYSAIGGLYRQFELAYIVADERDVIRVRTNFRKGEDVYLYRVNEPLVKTIFMEYVRTVNELHETPRWYNAITDNCTSAIRHQRSASDRPPWDWRMLVNGFGDELLYERGALDRSLPFAELKQRAHINERAHAANDAPDFSQRIRVGMPPTQ
ncbi:MAG: hypothetical protein RLZZ282_662 [Verrucomicrobiota bacterium]|jgi:hypothetical protein